MLQIPTGGRQTRLRAVSLFLESPWERMQNKYACEVTERDVGAAMPRSTSSVGVGKRVTPTLLAAHGITLPHHAHSHVRTLTSFVFFPTDFQGKERLLAI